MKKKLLIFSLLFLLISSFAVWFFFFFDKTQQLAESYDQKNPQKPVTTYQEINNVLASFKTVNYYQLDKEYIKKANLYAGFYHSQVYYVIKGEDIFKYLVGKFRVMDFLPRDEYFMKNVNDLSANHKQYLLLNKNLLYKFLDLMNTLEKRNFQKDAFSINHAFRYPSYNDKIGGAKGSLHTYGMAIDIKIADIDKDGKIEKEDKKIVLDILDKEIIGQYGGIGRYPWSQTIHFDVRGWYARWDKQH